MLFAPISTLYRWMLVKGERATITPSMCVGVRVYCSSDTVSAPSLVSRVLGPLATIGADVSGADAQANVSMVAAASATAETRRMMWAYMDVSERVRFCIGLKVRAAAAVRTGTLAYLSALRRSLPIRPPIGPDHVS